MLFTINQIICKIRKDLLDKNVKNPKEAMNHKTLVSLDFSSFIFIIYLAIVLDMTIYSRKNIISTIILYITNCLIED